MEPGGVIAHNHEPHSPGLKGALRGLKREFKNSLARTFSKDKDSVSCSPAHGLQHGLDKLHRMETHVFRGLDSHDNVHDLYTLGEQIGKGAFGTVYKAVDKLTGAVFCAKVIPKAALTDQLFEDIRLEAEVMCHLRGHPHIVEFMGMFQTDKDIYIIQELCSGGDLYTKLVKSHVPYTEKDAAAIMQAILKVLQHCHSHGVLYRDIKPENFLLSSDGPDAVLKATDFGVSCFLKPQEVATDFCGTPSTMAPEVFDLHYSYPADVWAAGVTLYWILSGDYPFKGRSKMELARKATSEPVPLETDAWETVSPEAKDLIRLMLTKDAAKRPTPAELLQHKWFRAVMGLKPKALGNVVLCRMRQFSHMNLFKRQVISQIVSTMDEGMLLGLRSMFDAIDTDLSGSLSVEEMMSAMTFQGVKVDAVEVKALLTELDQNGDGALDFLEFAAAAFNISLLESRQVLQGAFAWLGPDADGKLHIPAMATALQRQLKLSDRKVYKVVTELSQLLGVPRDGQIDFHQFCLLVLGEEPEDLAFRKRVHKPPPGSLFSKEQKPGSGPVPNTHQTRKRTNYRGYVAMGYPGHARQLSVGSTRNSLSGAGHSGRESISPRASPPASSGSSFVQSSRPRGTSQLASPLGPAGPSGTHASAQAQASSRGEAQSLPHPARPEHPDSPHQGAQGPVDLSALNSLLFNLPSPFMRNETQTGQAGSSYNTTTTSMRDWEGSGAAPAILGDQLNRTHGSTADHTEALELPGSCLLSHGMGSVSGALTSSGPLGVGSKLGGHEIERPASAGPFVGYYGGHQGGRAVSLDNGPGVMSSLQCGAGKGPPLGLDSSTSDLNGLCTSLELLPPGHSLGAAMEGAGPDPSSCSRCSSFNSAATTLLLPAADSAGGAWQSPGSAGGAAGMSSALTPAAGGPPPGFTWMHTSGGASRKCTAGMTPLEAIGEIARESQEVASLYTMSRDAAMASAISPNATFTALTRASRGRPDMAGAQGAAAAGAGAAAAGEADSSASRGVASAPTSSALPAVEETGPSKTAGPRSTPFNNTDVAAEAAAGGPGMHGNSSIAGGIVGGSTGSQGHRPSKPGLVKRSMDKLKRTFSKSSRNSSGALTVPESPPAACVSVGTASAAAAAVLQRPSPMSPAHGMCMACAHPGIAGDGSSRSKQMATIVAVPGVQSTPSLSRALFKQSSAERGRDCVIM